MPASVRWQLLGGSSAGGGSSGGSGGRDSGAAGWRNAADQNRLPSGKNLPTT